MRGCVRRRRLNGHPIVSDRRRILVCDAESQTLHALRVVLHAARDLVNSILIYHDRELPDHVQDDLLSAYDGQRLAGPQCEPRPTERATCIARGSAEATASTPR
jgi:hypothetical protein